MATQTLAPNTAYQLAAPTLKQCTIRMDGGAIAVTPSTTGQVQVVCRTDPASAGKFLFTADINGTLTGQGRRKPGTGGFAKVVISVEIPTDCALDLHAVAGSIDVGRHGASVTAQTSAGSIHVARAAGVLSMSASGGSIAVDEMLGQLTARANGGSIKLINVKGSTDADASGGSIEASLLSPPDARLKASGGSIRLKVDRSAAFNLIAAATGGTVTVSSPLVPTTVTGSHFAGRINGGGTTTVDLCASAGSIAVSAA